ncbi:LysR substrate-binding domain-containing protein [Acinetobacter baumannii]
MKDLNDLFFFVKIIECGGFSAASHELMVTKSLLSRRMAELENRLGVKLLNRTTRQVSVTEVGKIYYQHCKAMLIEAEAAEEAIEYLTSEPRGLIKLSCPINLLHINVSQMLNEFLALYPKVKLHVEATNRRVDLIDERFDLAIRIRPWPLPDSELIVRELALARQFVVASPNLTSQYFSVSRPEQLADWPILMMESFAPEYTWHLHSQDQQEAIVKCYPRFTTTDLTALRNATLQGLGIAKLPELVVYEDLMKGTLENVLPEWQFPPEMIHLVYTSRRGLLPSVKLLIDFLIEKFNRLKQDASVLY